MAVREGVLPLCGGGGAASLLGPFGSSLSAAGATDWPDWPIKGGRHPACRSRCWGTEAAAKPHRPYFGFVVHSHYTSP